MTRIVLIMGCVLALVAAIPSPEVLGQGCPDCPIPGGGTLCTQVPMPCIGQDPNPVGGVCRGWCLENVGPNTWDLTVRSVVADDPSECFGGGCRTRYFVTIPTGDYPVIIRKLTILRPRAGQVLVILAEDWPGYRMTRVDEIWTEPQGQDGLDGYVSVNAYVEGSLGSVSNVNRLVALTHSGDIEGPINAVMHPQSDRDPITGPNPFNVRNSYIDLGSTLGSLTGDVSIATSPGENPVRGVITWLQFGGRIGTSAQRVNIHADGVIARLRTNEIHADIGGTGACGADSYVHLVGSVETLSPPPTGGEFTGEFTGEIRAVRACASSDYADEFGGSPLFGPLVFGGPMRGRAYIQELRRKTTANDTWIAMPLLGLERTISLGSVSPGEEVWDASVALQSSPGQGNPPDPNDLNQIVFTVEDSAGYTTPRSAASLGGGAVGVVPFRTHSTIASPPSRT